jgi:hypothetical protein
MKSIDQQWEEFYRATYPLGTVPDQIRQVKQAFFAGAFVAIQSAVSVAPLPDDEAVAQLGKLLDECEKACGQFAALSASRKGRN